MNRWQSAKSRKMSKAQRAEKRAKRKEQGREQGREQKAFEEQGRAKGKEQGREQRSRKKTKGQREQRRGESTQHTQHTEETLVSQTCSALFNHRNSFPVAPLSKNCLFLEALAQVFLFSALVSCSFLLGYGLALFTSKLLVLLSLSLVPVHLIYEMKCGKNQLNDK